MKTTKVALDEGLLKEADRVARRLKLNRSALVREALRQYLRQVRVREREAADRAGYEKHPERAAELGAWDRVTSRTSRPLKSAREDHPVFS